MNYRDRQGFHIFALFENRRYPLVDQDIGQLIVADSNTKISLWDEDKEEYLEVYKKDLSDFEVYEYMKDSK